MSDGKVVRIALDPRRERDYQHRVSVEFPKHQNRPLEITMLAIGFNADINPNGAPPHLAFVYKVVELYFFERLLFLIPSIEFLGHMRDTFYYTIRKYAGVPFGRALLAAQARLPAPLPVAVG